MGDNVKRRGRPRKTDGDRPTLPADNIIVEALAATEGNITAAAQKLGVKRAALAKRVAKSAALREAWEEPRSILVDAAEQALREAITNGEQWAIKYALDSTRAASRGWRKAAQSAPTTSPESATPTTPTEQGQPADLTPEQLATLARKQIGVDDEVEGDDVEDPANG